MKKALSILVLALAAMTANAKVAPTYSLTKANGAEVHGTIKFYVGETEVTKAAEGATVTMIITPSTGDDCWSVGTATGQWIAVEAKAPQHHAIGLLKDIDLGNGATDQTTGAVTYTFTMERADAEISCTYRKLLTNKDINIADIEDVTYTTQPLTPEVTVKDGEKVLTLNTDYTVSYTNNVNAGTGTVTITGIGEYAGTVTKQFTVNQAEGSVVFDPWHVKKTFGDEDFIVTAEFVGTGTLTYSSENEAIATVDATTGLVHIVGAGKVNIFATVSATDNYKSGYDWFELTVEPKEIDYEGGDVTQDEQGYTVNMTEDSNNPNPDPLPDDVDLSNLTYERDLTAPGNEQGGDGSGDIVIDEQPANLFTVCLPFAPKTIATAKYYTLTGVSGETLHFDEVAEVQSHTPYLVAVFGDVNITEDCTDLEINSMDINSTTVDGYTFTGTFTGKKNADALGLYVLQRNSQWGKVTSGSVFIPPFRAYVEAPATSAPLLEGTVGEATAIRSIRTTDMNGTERWYDLSGRRMVAPAKGIGILDGRKVVIK